jgi:signal recognition particle receptor subunit beta
VRLIVLPDGRVLFHNEDPDRAKAILDVLQSSKPEHMYVIGTPELDIVDLRQPAPVVAEALEELQIDLSHQPLREIAGSLNSIVNILHKMHAFRRRPRLIECKHPELHGDG